MKKNVIKMTFAAVCVVAAGMGGMKAYNAANQSETNLLLSENVEALSSGDMSDWSNNGNCNIPGGICWYMDHGQVKKGWYNPW